MDTATVKERGREEARAVGSTRGLKASHARPNISLFRTSKIAGIAEFYVDKKRRFRNFEAPKVVKCSVVVAAATRSGSAVKPHGEQLGPRAPAERDN